MVARLGGDEFAILQTTFDKPADISMLASRLIETVGAPYQFDGQQIMVGASVGIAIAPADGTDPDQLIKNADLALYRCKADGGSVYRFFEAEMDARMRERSALELDLRKAIMNGEFTLNYQAVVNIETGKVTVCEALDSLASRRTRLGGTDGFYPDRGRNRPHRADRRMGAQPGLRGGRALAGRNSRGGQCVSSSIQKRRLCSGHRHRACEVAFAGKQAGNRDYRVGPHAGQRMRHWPRSIASKNSASASPWMISGPATHRSAISAAFHSTESRSISHSFVICQRTRRVWRSSARLSGLGRSLGIVTTAEGVETQDQLEVLRTEGCTEAQGYLFSRPQNAAGLRDFLAADAKVKAVA